VASRQRQDDRQIPTKLLEESMSEAYQ